MAKGTRKQIRPSHANMILKNPRNRYSRDAIQDNCTSVFFALRAGLFMAVSSCLGRFCFLMAAGKNGYYAGRTFLCAEAASHTGVLIDHCVGTLKHGKGLAGGHTLRQQPQATQVPASTRARFLDK